jgi:fructose-1,6-bisphosphatase/inositol monophosphatase family enzyme
VALLLQEVGAECTQPRFAALRDGEVRFKAPGEVVTIADEEAEKILSRRLGEIRPKAVVIGEEAFSAHPRLASELSNELVWLVDPLDGTANFVAGSTDWAMMVALVEGGLTCAAWIWRPASISDRPPPQ